MNLSCLYKVICIYDSLRGIVEEFKSQNYWARKRLVKQISTINIIEEARRMFREIDYYIE